jgi:hypothetical protein
MEPVTTALISALSAGAALGLGGKEVAAQGLKDAYAGLKGWVKTHYPAANVEMLEKESSTSKARETIGMELDRRGAAEDTELLRLAQNLVAGIQQSPELARSIGIDVGELDQVNATFGRVLATRGATGVRIEKAKGGALSFGDVTAGIEPSETAPPKKA